MEKLKEEVYGLIDKMIELAEKGEVEKARAVLRSIETELIVMMIKARGDNRRLKK